MHFLSSWIHTHIDLSIWIIKPQALLYFLIHFCSLHSSLNKQAPKPQWQPKHRISCTARYVLSLARLLGYCSFSVQCGEGAHGAAEPAGSTEPPAGPHARDARPGPGRAAAQEGGGRQGRRCPWCWVTEPAWCRTALSAVPNGRCPRCWNGTIQHSNAHLPRCGTELSAVLSGAVRRAGVTLPPATRLRPRSAEYRNGSELEWRHETRGYPVLGSLSFKISSLLHHDRALTILFSSGAGVAI